MTFSEVSMCRLVTVPPDDIQRLISFNLWLPSSCCVAGRETNHLSVPISISEKKKQKPPKQSKEKEKEKEKQMAPRCAHQTLSGIHGGACVMFSRSGKNMFISVWCRYLQQPKHAITRHAASNHR
eukprot:COSAG06_NODE_2228_length_7296_cov_12.770321_8_plen_125_part_00